MGVNIHVPANDVWKFFQNNKKRLGEEMVAIAENEDTKYAVYLTEEDNYPLFSVCKGKGAPEYEEGAIDEKDCMDTAKRCFSRFLFPVTVNSKQTIPDFPDDDEDDEWFARREIEDEIYEREDELQLAMADFLQVALKTGNDYVDIMDFYGEDIVGEVLDYVLEFLAEEMCFPIYRPIFIEDEDTGEEIFEEYPYGTGVWDDSLDEGDQDTESEK